MKGQRFTVGEYASTRGGYPVFDRDMVLAFFVEESMAIQYCHFLRAYPQIANTCELCVDYRRREGGT